MRNRYFSPELRYTMPSASSSYLHKMKMIGSTSQLPSMVGPTEHQQQIGSYTYNTHKQIGSGYSSKVYMAKHKDNDQDYAIKVIQLKKYSNSNMQMLNNQIQILQKLDHPNVVRCYDIFKTATRCYIIMQYCPYGDLLGYLSKKGTLPLDQTLSIMNEVISGCQYLFERNIIHRDIKPANIIKGKNNWKIADFGFAINHESTIHSKYNVGTPLYMPPQALVSNLYSAQSDIFAVGIVFYEILVGSTPWESRTQKDLIRKMNNVAFKIPQKLQIAANIKNMLRQLCQVKAEKRMTKKEFAKIDLKHKQTEKKMLLSQQLPLKKSMQLEKNKFENVKLRAGSIQNFGCKHIKTLQSQSTNQNEQEEEIWRKAQSQNNRVLINQLHYCRFLYYLIKNSQYVLANEKAICKLNVVVFKHILKLVKKLADNGFNWLKLKEWDLFKASKKYGYTLQTLKEYSSRYERQYLGYIKSVPVELIREVNKEFPQLSNNSEFTVESYGKILKYLRPLIRQTNHNLGVVLSKNANSLSREACAGIEGLKSIFKYYRLVEISLTNFENYQHFQENSQIKVSVDYGKARSNSLSRFMELRNQIKSL